MFKEHKNGGRKVKNKEKDKQEAAPASEQPDGAAEAVAKGSDGAAEAVTEESASQPAEAEETASDVQNELEEAKAQAEDFKRKWYSVTAEYENYRRRTNGLSAQRYRDGRADVVSKLFPVGDNLERALKSCKEDGTRRGIEMVLTAFGKVLEEEGITCICPVGEPFDAEKCEAIMAVDPAEGEESGTVREVYLKGYEQGGKVLRFAQVVVAK